MSGDIGRYPSIQCFPSRTEPGVTFPPHDCRERLESVCLPPIASVPTESLDLKGPPIKPLTSEDVAIHIGIGMLWVLGLKSNC